ncbi:hypothetical protein SAMN05421640_1619 [Ekhidna lutea]|uniref:Uncharacterized protein n=1 Tax=Ekhidna lutea TaxID=447679 RepID=A0A239IF94_EKHLU|nr:hypothetical protein SAMN05421640_1619 [Ekhidna lutea]
MVKLLVMDYNRSHRNNYNTYEFLEGIGFMYLKSEDKNQRHGDS